MRIFAVSDLHIDHPINRLWLNQLSRFEFRDDVLILSGDVSDSLVDLEWCLRELVQRFRQLVFVPGNHELWVLRDKDCRSSLQKLQCVRSVAHQCGAATTAVTVGTVTIVPLLAWYDYSFGHPNALLREVWMDFSACRWPEQFTMEDVTHFFLAQNEHLLNLRNDLVISFSHFLPRIDLMPSAIPLAKRMLYPVLGTSRLDDQIRRLKPDIHIYGHSHVNRRVLLDGILYINSAFGYPHESTFAGRRLVRIHESQVQVSQGVT